MSNSIRKQGQGKPYEEKHLQLLPFGGVSVYCLYTVGLLKSKSLLFDI
jgi:hypothetical protein